MNAKELSSQLRDAAKDPPSAVVYADRLFHLLRHAIAALAEREAEVEGLREDAAIGKLVREKLVSGNSVPVWHCTIRADEVAAIDSARGKV